MVNIWNQIVGHDPKIAAVVVVSICLLLFSLMSIFTDFNDDEK